MLTGGCEQAQRARSRCAGRAAAQFFDRVCANPEAGARSCKYMLNTLMQARARLPSPLPSSSRTWRFCTRSERQPATTCKRS